MRTPVRMVRFYTPVLITQNKTREDLSTDFWSVIFEDLDPLTEEEREHEHEGVRLYGQVRVCDSPAKQYLYIGRVRSQDRFPDHFRRGEGSRGRLQPGRPGDEMAEPTYVVPFGSRNAIAVLAPVSAPVRSTGLARWLNRSLNFHEDDRRIELEPLLSPSLERDLRDAVGATKTKVKLLPNADPPEGMGQVGTGLALARAAVDDDAYVEIGFSFGVRGAGSDSGRSGILGIAKAVVDSPPGTIASASVNLEVPDDDGGTRVIPHNLVEDIAGEKVRLSTTGTAEEIVRRVVAAALDAAESYERQRRDASDAAGDDA